MGSTAAVNVIANGRGGTALALILARALAQPAASSRSDEVDANANWSEDRAATSSVSSPNISAPASMAACGSARTPQSRTSAGSAATSFRRCGPSRCRTCAGQAAASPTNITGVRGSARPRDGQHGSMPAGAA